MSSTNLNDLLVTNLVKKLESTDHFLDLQIDKQLFESQGLIQKNNIRKPQIPKGKKLTFFLDIDSTITDEDSDLPDPRCKPIFTEMQNKHKHKIYFITGRPTKKVRSVIKSCNAKCTAIVENGGLIINSKKVLHTYGDRNLCLKSYKKIILEVKNAKIARNHQNTTEVILEKNNSIGKIRQFIKKNNLDVEINASKRFYHLHKKGIHKGYGMTGFIHENNIDYRYTVAIGDSEIDMPMIKKARFAYLVKNAPKSLQNRVNPDQILSKKSFDGVIEAFMKLEPKIIPFIETNGFLK